MKRPPPLPRPRPTTAPPPPTAQSASLLPGIVVGSAIAVSGLVAAALMLFVFRERRPPPPPAVPAAVAEQDVVVVPSLPIGPTPEERVRARTRLQEAAGARPWAEIREEAEQLAAEIDALRRGTRLEPGLRLRPAGGADPRQATERAIAAARRAEELLRQPDDSSAGVAELEAATGELAAALAALDAARELVPTLAEAERQARVEEMTRKDEAERAKRQRDAFAAFAKQDTLTVALPGAAADDLSSNRQISRIDLGPFPVADLVAPSLRLAVPEEMINGARFAAEIAEVEPGRWEVRVTKGFSSLDGKPVAIGGLAARDGMLVLEVDRKMLDQRPMAILRRCVILAEAQDPETKQPRVREIRLVQPTKVGLLQVIGVSEAQSLQIPVPPGIASRDTPPGASTALDLALPASGIEVTAELNGRQETVRLPERAAPDQPGIVNWPSVSLGQLGEGVALDVQVEISLPTAVLKATPALAGAKALRFNLETLAEFQSKHASKLSDVEEDFGKRVKACPGRDFKKARGTPIEVASVNTWFDKKLAPSDWLPLALPGHNTFAASIGAFLGEEYAKQARSLRDQWEREVAAEKDEKKKKEKQDRGPPLPDFPRDFADWQKCCGEAGAQQWPREFTARLDAWADWFWRKVETQWEATTKMARGLNQPVDLKLLEIVSLARDAKGREYRVPLVLFDALAPSARAEVGGDAVQPSGGDDAPERASPATESNRSRAKATGF